MMLEEYVADNWSRINLGGAQSASFFLSIGGGVDSNSANDNDLFLRELKARELKVSVPVCIYSGKTPVAWIKVCQNDKYSSLIKREYESLLDAYNSVDKDFRQSMPVPIVMDKIDGKYFFIQSYVQGDRMKEVVKSWRFYNGIKLNRNLNLVREWLVEFQRQTMCNEKKYTKEFVCQNVLAPFLRNKDRIILNKQEEAFFNLFERRLEALDECKVPMVPSHGDFFAGNIIVKNGGRVSVIDWCDYEKISHPFLDVFTLACTFRFPGRDDKENILNALEFSFLKNNWLSYVLKKFMRKYVQASGYDFDIVKIFYPIFLMNRIMREWYAIPGSINAQYWREHLQLYIENEKDFWR